MICPKCNSQNVTVQTITEQKKRGLIASILWILLAFCTCGIAILIPLIIQKGSKTRDYAICQNCGYRWKV